MNKEDTNSTSSKGRLRRIISATAFITLVTPGSALLAQDIPAIVLPPQLPSLVAPETARPSKGRPIGTRLLELQDRFLRLPVLQQNDPDVQLVSGMVTIEAIATDAAGALLSDLQDLGLEGGVAFGRLVSGKLPLSAVSAASALTTLEFVSLSRAFTRSQGLAFNQGDSAMDTQIARTIFGVDGSGISVGILSDSYDQLGGEAADIASGDLPMGVVVLLDTATGPNIDEGRAMAQLIHDIAPGADLLFRTAFNGRADFAQGILDLANAGADIIVDDIGYFAAPFFQDGPVAQAVDQVVASGVSYFSAAGNSDNNSYEAPYVDSGLPFTGGSFAVNNTHQFGGSGDNVQEFLLLPGQSILLSIQWDQPFASSGGAGSANDLDAFLVDSSFALLTESINTNLGGDAVELIFHQNTSGSTQVVGLIVGVFSGVVPGVLKWINFDGDVPHNHFTNSSTTYAHPNAAGAVAVGASRYDQTPPFGVAPAIIEPFSSHGGLAVLFDTAGNPLTVPDDRSKPDLTAPDGVDTTFFSNGDFDSTGFPNFFGTSAAAPNAAALAALQLECDPALLPADIRSQQTDTALDMESPGFDNISGAGLVDGLAALVAACGPIPVMCNGLPVDVFIGNGDIPTAGNDVILGTSGADFIDAGAGNDTICGLGGADTILAGGGADYVEGGNGADEIFGEGGDDTILGGPGTDEIDGGGGDDEIFGDGGNDTLLGRGGEDIIDGGVGVDAINGGPNADTIFTGRGATVGSGVFVSGGAAGDTIFGGPDADDLRGSGGADTIMGDGGNDVIAGGIGRDELHGGDGNDDLRGQGSRDELFGDAGNDNLTGGTGDDDLDGGAGVDSCAGQAGINDTAANCETESTIP